MAHRAPCPDIHMLLRCVTLPPPHLLCWWLTATVFFSALVERTR